MSAHVHLEYISLWLYEYCVVRGIIVAVAPVQTIGHGHQRSMFLPLGLHLI